MSEKRIRETAKKWGLAVLKRITTGSALAHFATFELSGRRDDVLSAWKELAPLQRHKDFDSLRTVSNSEHPDYGQQYIELDGVWCEE